jgi:tRNA (adenine57-N1/adenine58-N1)-methyltransferase catalytic subunit
MSTLRRLPSRTLRTSLGFGSSLYSTCSRRFYFKREVKGLFSANSRQFFVSCSVENDIVLLRNIRNSSSTPILSSRLQPGEKIELVKDSISHDDILGKRIRDLVSSKKRINYRISEPTLAEYTDLSPRLVTPVSYSICPSPIFL